jgi:thiosulfate dehydrogenase [quinone] large subunit
MGDAERSGGWLGLSDFQLAYALFRITIGVNIFGHGAMRIISDGGAYLGTWVVQQGAAFEDTMLPMWSVHAFLYVLPFIEVLLGGLTALGLKTRLALVGSTVMMFVLVFGNLTRMAWETVGNNMHYVLYYCLMIAAIRFNCVALDTRRS